jgi:flagellar biosynthesis/type III secretory pathway protein FliH
MGMIRRADLEQLSRDAMVMNLDDLRARGEAMVEDATHRAEQILSDANAERERLVSTGHQAGFEQGHAEGVAAGLEQGMASGSQEARAAESEALRLLTQGWEAALASFESDREKLLREARTDLVRLALEIATRVVRRAVDIDPRAIESQLEAVLGSVARPTKLSVRVHPDDVDYARRTLPGMLDRFELCKHAEVVSDGSIGRGSVVATTEGGGRIDASVQGQLDRIVAEVLPDDPELLGGPDVSTEREQKAADPRSDAA